MENKGVILLVEDNAALNISNSRALKLRGYEVLTALTLTEARGRLREKTPDIILLDVMMPDGDGFAFCEEIRDPNCELCNMNDELLKTHIIFLTAKTEHENIIRGLTGGGDDYITKPFHPEELLTRVDTAMRRRHMSGASVQVITKGFLTLDIIAGQAYIEGEDLNLQTKEFSLLHFLVQNEGKIIATEDLYAKVWGRPLGGDKSAIQKAASRLRKRLAASSYTVRSVYNRGYIFEQIK